MPSPINSARSAEDLHAILSRFQTWAGKHPENHNGHRQRAADVREIPMEEAMRLLRSRRTRPRASAAEKPRNAQPPLPPAAREAKTETAPRPAAVSQPVAAAPIATDLLEPTALATPVPKARPVVKAPRATPSPKRAPIARCEAIQKVIPKKTEGSAPARKREMKSAGRKRRASRKPAKRAQSAAKNCQPGKGRPGKKPEFREVLACSVRAEAPKKRQGRRQRVSVRLSSAEGRRLQQRATLAGLTISDYLRRSALEAETPGLGGRSSKEMRTRQGRPAMAAPLSASSAGQNASMLGGWIALLRNRFLASPTRFAERA